MIEERGHIGNLGVTLPELLVAVVLVGILISATLYVFSSFFSASLSQERHTMEQSDAQVGGQFIKWDVFMAGYGIPGGQLPISSQDNVGENGSDVLSLASAAFGPSGNAGKWSYILAPVTGANNILVRRWNDPDQDIAEGDYIIILSPTKAQVGLPVYQVTDRQTAVGPAGQDAWLLTLSNTVSTSLNFVFVLGDSSGPQTVTYSIQNGNLMRDSTVFMPGVVDFQIAYWVDIDGDKVQDANEIVNDLSVISGNPSLIDNIRLVRMTIVTAVRGGEGYLYPADTIVVENNVLDLAGIGRNFRYDRWQTIVKPRNL